MTMTRPARESTLVDVARHWAALAIAIGWSVVYIIWLLRRDTPACHITTLQVARGVTTTRSCGLPSLPDGLYALIPVVLLLLPDVDTVAWPGGSIRRRRARRLVAPAAPAVRDVAAGDTPGQAQDAGTLAAALEAGEGAKHEHRNWRWPWNRG
jgi:hypothetical protein